MSAVVITLAVMWFIGGLLNPRVLTQEQRDELDRPDPQDTWY